MNDNEIALDLKIKTAESATTVKELKTSIKQLKDELSNVSAGSDEFKKLTKAINETEGKVGDINDQFKTLTGSGVERANSSLGLLKEGFSSFDFEKIKLGLSGVGAAFKAIPIFLIMEGVRYLVENFTELSEGSGVLAKALRFVSDIFTAVKDAIYEVTDALGLTNSELDKQGDAIKTNAEKLNAALDSQIKKFDEQIKVAKASGKNTVDLEIAKQEAIIETNRLIVEQIIAFVRAGGEFNDEKKKQLTASLDLIRGARSEEKVIELTHQKELRDDYKKHLDDKLALDKKHGDDLYQQHLTEVAQFNKLNEDQKAKEKADRLREDEELKSYIATSKEEENAASTVVQEQRIEVNRQTEEQIRAEKQKTAETTLNATKQGLQAAQALTDLYFGYQLRQAKGNADKEREIRKKQFNVNKAFGIANAVIDGVGAVQKALNNPYPLNIVLAVLSGVLAAANVAKIASSKFDDGGGSSGSAGDVGGGNISAPVIPQPNNTTTQLNPNGTAQGQGNNANQPVVIKNEIVETQITEKQERVAKIKESATYG